MTVRPFSPLTKRSSAAALEDVFVNAFVHVFSHERCLRLEFVTTANVLQICKNTLMEHDRFLHTEKHEECNVSLHACGDFKRSWK